MIRDHDGDSRARPFILKLNLKADLVVRSASERARGRVGYGEGSPPSVWPEFPESNFAIRLLILGLIFRVSPHTIPAALPQTTKRPVYS